jgi:hypothetical protein
MKGYYFHRKLSTYGTHSAFLLSFLSLPGLLGQKSPNPKLRVFAKRKSFSEYLFFSSSKEEEQP